MWGDIPCIFAGVEEEGSRIACSLGEPALTVGRMLGEERALDDLGRCEWPGF
jgi:hypothetical protein